MNPTLLLGLPGGPEWLIILLIVLLLFGGKKLPGLMKGLGKGIKEFKDAKNDTSKELEEKDEN
ncbi:MAG: twin-arginine translocase TatA/TatE family subunit [Flavobacteriales bacterium]|nr:twin-arginine translocase TatA/TatE family subunit [Flavobacteriales bacterium]|tara:strand:+ start:425 stop:613 length:189 start_codon:yes stop_codon:yes gene_type:complete